MNRDRKKIIDTDRPMTQNEILDGLQAGRRLRCDRRDAPLLPWLLSHPKIENSGIVQMDDQYSYVEFRWRNTPPNMGGELE